MASHLPPFSQWALDDARSHDERFFIFHLCEACRRLEHMRKPPEQQRACIFKSFPYEKWKEFYLNPLLLPEYGLEDVRRAEEMSPHLKTFGPVSSGHETRPFGDAGEALRFFPALETLTFGWSSLRDLSFLEALPHLRELHLSSGMLEDLAPLRHARSLRRLHLCLSTSGTSIFTPPLYWVDASALGHLQELTHLSLSPNPAVLRGLCFPSLHSAELEGSNCIQPDCTHLPEMPALRILKLSGVQSLRGIGRFSELRHLKISGPLRDFADIHQLQHLDCLEVDTTEGWPRDVSTLSTLPELLWVRFGGEIPRNYWPLAKAPRLCELNAGQVPAVHLEVQAINAVLCPWDGVFAAPRRRPLPPLRFVSVAAGGDASVIPRGPDAPGPEFIAHPKRLHLEHLWMNRRVNAAVQNLLGNDDPLDRCNFNGSEICWGRTLRFSLETLDAAQRFPEILDLMRRCMADSPHEWIFHVSLNLRLKEMEMTEQQKKWLRMIQSRSRDWDDDDSLERYKKTKNHVIETQFRKRLAEEGEDIDPEDFEPPEEIRPEPYPRVTVPASGGAQDEKEKQPDFELKPYDEQEQNDSSDDDDDGSVKTAHDPDPPDHFWDDPYAHPLADSYRFYATLTLDAFYHHGHNLATVIQLMRRGPDEYYAAPDCEG